MLIEIIYENLYHEEIMSELTRDDEKQMENIRHMRELMSLNSIENNLDRE